jgi:transcriptional regulator with XRE-family HTH domain
MDGDAEMQRRLAYAIQAAMAVKGWKAPDLARALGRDPSTVNRWVNGESVPNLFMVKQIAEALDVRPELVYDPPPVPDYPLSEYLVRREGALSVAEGAARARRPRRASGDA